MSSQAQTNPGQVANTASDCARKHEEEDDSAGNDDERGGGGGDQFGAGVEGAAGSAERRDRVPSLQPPMAAFKVASVSQERICSMPHVVMLSLPSTNVRKIGKYHLLLGTSHKRTYMYKFLRFVVAC